MDAIIRYAAIGLVAIATGVAAWLAVRAFYNSIGEQVRNWLLRNPRMPLQMVLLRAYTIGGRVTNYLNVMIFGVRESLESSTTENVPLSDLVEIGEQRIDSDLAQKELPSLLGPDGQAVLMLAQVGCG
jgi:hypothetical protein